MAGVKGRSGGPRKNSGGKRPGAGRPPKFKKPAQPALPELTNAQEAALGASLPRAPDAPPPPMPAAGIKDAKEFLERVLAGEVVADAQQLEAAKLLLPFQHRKAGEIGKKEAAKEEAKKVANRFAPAPPRLMAAKTVN